MNTGIFGEGFPYSNFHDLNMDWIIKIAKDFLDQYTHIQETITDGETAITDTKNAGIEELETKKAQLELLLDAWYNTHSEDIANQLTTAIADFITAANTKTADSLASIPADYTTLSNSVSRVEETVNHLTAGETLFNNLYETDKYVNASTHQETALEGFNLYRIPCKEHDYVFVSLENLTVIWPAFTYTHAINLVDTSGNYQPVGPVATQTSATNDYFYYNTVTDSALLAILVPANIKAVSISLKAGTEANVTYNVNRAYPAIYDGKTPSLEETPFKLTDKIGIRSYLYRTYNSDYKYSWLSDPAESLAIRVHAGDTIVFSKIWSEVSFLGTFIPDSNPTGRATRIASPQYTFYESGLLYSFIINGEFNATIYPLGSCQYTDLKGVAFGTSITQRALTTGGYLQYLPMMLKAKSIDNQGIGSSVILPHGTYADMMSAIENYAGYSDKDFCILEGFTNDWYVGNTLGTWTDTGSVTVCGRVRQAINHILTQNPSITLILVLDHIGQLYDNVDASSLAVANGKTQMEYYNTIAQVAESMGIVCIKLYKDSEMNEKTPYMYIDNIHPSTQGAKQTAKVIYQKMRNIPVKIKNQ